ncbi:MAG: Tex-like N-terminal domain-containing protein, partial [Saprospiraceae bacterium]
MSVYTHRIAQVLSIPLRRVEATLELLETGATIPFIARYRKEATGELDEVQIADIQDAWKKFQELDKRRDVILQSIGEQGKLTPELRQAILAAATLTELEDIYLPYRPKRKTRASIAIERGLESLAKRLFAQRDREVEILAEKYLTEQVPTVADAHQGARDIIAEWITEDKVARDRVRRHFEKGALISARVVKGQQEAGKKYSDYFEWSEPLAKCAAHRLLAMRRGEEEGFLRVAIAPDEERPMQDLERQFVSGYGAAADQVRLAVKDSYKRLLQPGIETEFRNSSKEKADLEAIRVFAENLRQLLLAAPLGEQAILGIDPGFRSGCKVVCLDRNGNLLHNTIIYPHEPQRQVFESQSVVEHLVDKYGLDAIAVGNGTAGRETMDFLQKIKFTRPIEVFPVNEAGASIYS